MAEVKTGVGRIVWGHPAKAQQKKDVQTKQPIMRDGKPVEQWVFGVAFPKAEFQQLVWPTMAQEAATGYPAGVPPKFSWKYVDGDGVDSTGKPYSTREGYAGHYVLTVSTEAFAPPIYKFQNGGYVQLQADQIKTGDYIVLALNIKVNVPQDRTHTPGLYINPQAIELVGYGTEIQRGIDPNDVFGGQQYQLPPGASTTPIASSPAGVAMPGTMPGAPAGYPPQPQPGAMPGYTPPPQPQPGATVPGYPQQPMQPAPQQMPAPAPDFTGYPQPGAMPGAPAGYPQQPAPQQMPAGMPGMPGPR